MEKTLKIGYFADGLWGLDAFNRILIDNSLEIVFLTVRYDKRDPMLIKIAQQKNIPVVIEKNINSAEAVEKYASYNADIFVSMSFDQIFRKTIINLNRYKPINCHAGKLPYYRGRNVLNWVLINDEKEFGITVHFVDEGIDTGDIILQKTFPITDEDDYSSLLTKAHTECGMILYEAIKKIQSEKILLINQKEIDPIGLYCGIRGEGDEILNWNQSSRDIFNFVRAICDPGPKARSFINGKEIKINKVKMVSGAVNYINTPGQVLGKTACGFYVKSKDTIVEVIEYEYDGKIKVGDRLKSYL